MVVTLQVFYIIARWWCTVVEVLPQEEQHGIQCASYGWICRSSNQLMLLKPAYYDVLLATKPCSGSSLNGMNGFVV